MPTVAKYSKGTRLKQKLSPMRYKTFTWPNNPSECKYNVTKAYAEHKYPELAGVEIEDMDNKAIVLTGSGEFFGDGAYESWKKLVSVFNEHGVGEFFHPIYPDLTKGLMTELTSTLEPREDYVAYTFTFVCHSTIPWVHTTLDTGGTEQVSPVEGNTEQSVQDNDRTIVVGDTVICNGYAYYDSYGSNPHTKLLVNYTGCVTHVNYKGTHPICVDSLGWMRLSDVALGSTTGGVSPQSQQAQSSGQTYTVVPGDTLWGIAQRFYGNGSLYTKIASANGIANPNLIYSGTVLTIP